MMLEKFNEEQKRIIKSGFIDGLDASIYANPNYSANYMRQMYVAMMLNYFNSRNKRTPKYLETMALFAD
ncbi:hypothetical protein Q5O24_06505 [Eubacteriaceae bacterium ES3]|nr:hypothetical protein Q5O24_06505 [Eubacteriaceae bacterium ES3]